MFWRIYIVISLACLNALIEGKCPGVIRRQEWGSAYPLTSDLLTLPVQKVIFLHSATFECHRREKCQKFMQGAQIYHADELGQCGNVNFVSRSQWGSVLPLPRDPLDTPATHVFFHHTVTPECTSRDACSARVRQMQEYHAGLGWEDIGYNFVIGGDGGVYVGRGWSVQGIHTKGHNQGSLGIAFVGNFQSKDPNPKMLNAARNLLACGVARGDLSNNYGLYGGRDGTCIESPGLHFYNSLKSWPHWHQQGNVNKVC